MNNYEQYEEYENLFDPMQTDRHARRKRKPKAKHVPKKAQRDVIEEIADTTGLEGGFETTYTPSLFEGDWLLSSLRTFYDQQMLTDVLALVKGGKEASVYRCEAHPSTQLTYLAAKVYRPRKFRNLRNDKLYRENRKVLKSNGKVVKDNDHRIMRALGKKTGFGQQVAHTSWLMYEYTTLEHLHNIGAAVPRPLAAGENAILMEYVGDGRMAAPTLHEVQLDASEAQPLFEKVMDNIELMLQHSMVHGDLSSYNILYWDGDITLIDFPQVIDPQANPKAYFILERDITRVCDYFVGYGVDCANDPARLMEQLWERYVGQKPRDIEADLSRFEVDDE